MDAQNEKKNMKQRPPVVVVMGHVDHGKTSLLDYIRKSTVAIREAGGITQSIGAYEILHVNSAPSPEGSGDANAPQRVGRKITFIDTPGHEAFTKMRSRGAEVADLAILVVAADEGVKPQTKEAIDILLKSETQFIVAITKIDKPGADIINRAKNDLASAGVLLEGYGGSVSYHEVSSKTGEGVNDLLDLILLASDLENLIFDESAPASGYVLEARRDPSRGIEASVVVKNGILKRGCEIHTPSASGKVKILENFLGKAEQELSPSAPALIIGFENLPQVGEVFSADKNDIEKKEAQKKIFVPPIDSKTNGKKTLNFILKASDAGSLEAFSSSIKNLDKEKKPLNIIDESVGDITDNDLKNAIATGSSIIGFKNKMDKGAKNLAEAHEVRVVTSEVIYDLIKAVEEFLEGDGKSASLGELEILAVFNQKKLSEQLVGGKILRGILRNRGNFEILRGEEKIGNGRILSMREKKSDLEQAEAGTEVGVVVSAQTQIQIGDHLIAGK